MANKNDWVQIHIDVLKPEERATNIPEDTRHVPLEMWVKGHLMNDEAEIGDLVSIKTKTGRIVEGTMCAVNPSFKHNFGDYVPELDEIEETVKTILFGGRNDA
jgi:hypothetical protein